MPRARERSTLLKSFPRAPGRDRLREGYRSRPDRGLVRGRGPDRAEEQDHPLVAGARRGFLSIVTGGGKWVLIEVEPDPVYQTVLIQVERIFWRCVKTGEPPRVFGAEPPKPKLAAVRVVDMADSNAWAEHAAIFARTRVAYLEHESARGELKALVP